MIWLRRLVALAGLALLWQAGATFGGIPAEYLPPPATVVRALLRLLGQPAVLGAELLTVSRAFVGLLAAILLGLVLAIAGALCRPLRRALEPLTELLRPLPPAAIVPIAIFAFGLGYPLFIFIIVMVSIWPIYLNTAASLDGTSQVLLLTGRSFGCSRWSVLWQVQLPQALPDLFIGIRTAAAISLIATIVAEMLAGRNGIGFLLFQKAFAIQTADVFALTLLCGLNGMALNQLVLLSRELLTGWHGRMMREA